MSTEQPGSAHLVLARNVIHLDPASAVIDAMREGWARQQSARFLRPETIGARLRLIARFGEFTGLYPWQWTPAEGEAFIAHLRSGGTPIRLSTARNYEVSIGLFVEYLRDARYDWARVCLERFGEVPQPVFHEGNSVVHSVEYEGDPRRRPLDYDEIQALFDAADDRPGRSRGQGRKGALCALRDAAVLKSVYAFGMRRTESSRLDLVDLRRNRKAPQFGGFGSVMVRFGKSQKGSPPKRRTVLTVPEMDWIVEVLDQWVAGRLGRALADHDGSQRRLPRRRHCPRSASRQSQHGIYAGVCLGTGYRHQQQGAGLAALALAGLRAATLSVKGPDVRRPRMPDRVRFSRLLAHSMIGRQETALEMIR